MLQATLEKLKLAIEKIEVARIVKLKSVGTNRLYCLGYHERIEQSK